MVLCTGAVMGVPCTALYEVIKDVVVKTMKFRRLIEQVKTKIETLKPQIEEVEKCKLLYHPENELKEFKEHMQEGELLIPECSEVIWWNICKTIKYTDQLLGLQGSLERSYDKLKVLVIIDRALHQISAIKNRVHGWCAVPGGATFTVGMEMPLRGLKTKLLKDETVTMLVLTAAGGCGKTTLAIKFCDDDEVKDKFKDNIFFVTVSKKSDELVVQELYLSRGYEIPTLHNGLDVGKWLKSFLTAVGENPVLFVLDDVWPGSPLLQNFVDIKLPNSKILVTSRSEFPGVGSPYKLQPLGFDNAMKLFHHEASLEDRSSHIPPDISKQVVEGCKGFPLAITVAAKSLCGQPIEDWEKRLVDWSKGSSILDSEKSLRLHLQTSLDVSKLVKDCFLDLGSFPEDKRIPVAALIDIWTESYESLDKDNLCVANLHQITNRSLANLVVTRKDKLQGDGYYTEHFVTQHDLLRELGIYETELDDTEQRERLIINISEDNFPEWWSEQKYQCMKARLLSISTDGAFSTNWPDMELPEAEVLVLNFQTKNYALPQFLEKMVNLKVLVLTNYGIIRSELTNFQLLCRTSNLKRMRLERISIPSIAKHPIQFNSLQKISLFMCNIGQAFSDGSIQLSHAWPNLVEMNIDYCNDLVALPADTSDLILLKKLSITNNHKLIALPEDIGKLAKLELLRLRSCSGLEELPGSTGNLKKLNFLDISSCFSIKELPENFGELSSLRKLNMRDCSRLKELPLSVSNLEHLQVIGDDDTQSLWQPFLPIEGTHIVLAKENVNLNWLHKYQF